MNRSLPAVAIAFVAALLASAAAPPRSPAYDYPVDDPLLATVIGTRAQDYPSLPARVPSASLRMPRVDPAAIPPAFWDQQEVRYSLARQRGRAPLVFLIAGTGSRYSSDKMTFLEALLWGAGYHVAALSSPTHPDFILTASASHMPGYMPADVDDLYTLMRRIVGLLAEDDVEITSVSLVGFSLGGTEAAFLAERDSRERALGFRRVLLVNPAVDLFDSAQIFDRMFDVSLPDGGAGSLRLITDLLRRLTPYIHQRSRSRVDDEFLYAIAERENLTAAELSAIIATVFRLALANMVFTADVMTGGGHVVEVGSSPGVSTSLTDALKRASRFTFERYLDEVLLPYWRARRPDLDRERVIAAASLASIEGYLKDSGHIGVMTNADDIILTPAHLAFLRETFGERARIFPRGGHAGNLAYRDNAHYIVEFLGDGSEDMARR